MRIDLLNTKNNSRTNIIVKNIIGSLIIKGCSILISLAIVPLTLGYISSELYGIWLTLSSIMMWLNFFDIGFTLGLKNKLIEALALGDIRKGKKLVSTTYFIMIIIFVPLCITLILLTPHINWGNILNINETYNNDIIKAVYVLISCFCLQMIVNIISAVVAAYQKVALSSSFPVIGNFLSLIIILLLTKFSSPSLLGLAMAISTMPVLVLIIASFILYSKKFHDVAPSIKDIDIKHAKKLLNLGYKFFLIQIQVVVLYQCTNILISNVSSPNEVTEYNIAYKYLGIAMMLFTIILGPLWPAFTDAYSKKDFNWMKRIYKKMTYVFMCSSLLVILMTIVSPFVYNLWVGNKVSISIYMTLSIAIYMIIHSWDSLQIQLINGIGTLKLQTYITLIGLLLHIPLSLFIGKYLGALGVIWSMITINIIYSTFFTIQMNKLLNQKAKGIWAK